MANKKINQLGVRSPLSLTDLMLVGDPSTGYSYKTTIGDLSTFLETNIALNDLNDVTLSSPTNGQVLQYNGTAWVNATLTPGLTGSGASGWVAYWTGTSTLSGESGFFYDAVNDRMGLGTDNPETTLEVRSQGTTNARGFQVRHYDNTTAFSQAKIIGARARGSVGSPSAVLLNDSLVSFNARGYKATGWSDTLGGLYVYAAENFTDTATGTYITFRGVATGGTTVSEWMRITSAGNVGIGTTNPSTKLEVNGSILSTTSINVTASGTTTNEIRSNGLISIDLTSNLSDDWHLRMLATNSSTQSISANGSLQVYSNGNTSIGSGNNLIFQTNGTGNERARFFQSTGNLSIGYGASPTDGGFRLDVSGTARITSGLELNTSASTTVTPLTVTTNTTSGWGIQVKHPTTYNTYSLLTDTSLVFADSTLGQSVLLASTTRIVLRTGTSNTIAFGIGGSTLDERLRISSSLISINANQQDTDTRISGDNETNLLYADASVDRIGIGTSTPAYRLDVNGTGRFTNALWIYSVNTADDTINFHTGSTYIKRPVSSTEFHIGNSLGSGIQFFTSSERMRITNGGNVLISTTTDAGYRLQINGTTQTTALRISNGDIICDNSFIGNAFVLGGSTNLWFYNNSSRQIRANGTDITVFTTVPQLNSQSTFVINDAGTSPTGYKIQKWMTGSVEKAFLDRDGNFATLTSGIFGSIGSINSSAILEATSSTKGFLPPRMTGANAESISTPAAGLLVYVNNGNGTTITSIGWWGYDGTTWVKLN